MFILKILNQHGFDFTGIYKCEHCQKEKQAYGYNDDNFHINIVPEMVCDYCHKKTTKSVSPEGESDELNLVDKSAELIELAKICGGENCLFLFNTKKTYCAFLYKCKDLTICSGRNKVDKKFIEEFKKEAINL